MASASYKADEERSSLDAPVMALLSVLDLIEREEYTNLPSQNPSTFPPPELIAGWQFFLRTAASPRAPSFAS
ncbi:MAG: hypothetical protein ABS95_03100 [Verrucomicrobia bacterium SCN 57-15]|nr:MAG: hypothetical protein ABS95_03100 [Verrucomicrobia bacterium SCN 57-15]